MNFLVVGHSVVDKIIAGGSQTIKPGGIFYSVVTLLSQIGSEDNVFLCTNVDKENSDLFESVYSKVSKKYISEVNSIPVVSLIVNESGERKETYSHLTENLILPEDNPEFFDAVLINMITGYDLSLSQLNKLRKKFNGLIYFDVHTLSRGVDRYLKRKFKQIKNFYKWAECIDILQANESELKTLLEKSEEAEIVEELFLNGVQQVIVTRSERGATVFFNESNITKRIDTDALKVNTINKVGCGDVFGAVYFYNYVKDKNLKFPLEQANLYAGVATTYINPEDFLNLKKDAIERFSKK